MKKMVIPFFKPSISGGEINEVVETLKGGWLTTGARTKQFEREFAGYVKHKHAIALNSCTAALHLALEAIGLQPGEGVLVPTLTFAATAEVVRYFDARPILVDCNSEDFNLDVADAEQRLQEAIARGIKVVAIIPVHFAGQIGDVTGVKKLAEKYHLKIIEDAAHCCPAFYRENSEDSWKTVGTSADISCFSFYANKPITTGEGGMVCTERNDYAERMRIMSLHGISRDAWKRFSAEGNWYYEIVAPGYKYNLTDVASAIGIHQLRKADKLQMMRTRVADHYEHLLRDVEELILPSVHPDRIHGWHLYVVRLQTGMLSIDRAAVIQELKDAGITTSVHYMPLHMHPYYKDKFEYEPEDLPCAARLYEEVISLPSYPDMSMEEVDYVAETLKGIIAKHQKSIHLSVVQAAHCGVGGEDPNLQF
jgi:dTDP-4-amino-4,6-dideoxygalactose transaminase